MALRLMLFPTSRAKLRLIVVLMPTQWTPRKACQRQSPNEVALRKQALCREMNASVAWARKGRIGQDRSCTWQRHSHAFAQKGQALAAILAELLTNLLQRVPSDPPGQLRVIHN